jgi:hypothetical protein
MHSIPKNSRAFLMKMDPLRMLNFACAMPFAMAFDTGSNWTARTCR